MNAIAAAQERAIDVEQIRVLRVPAEAGVHKYIAAGLSRCHALYCHRIQSKTERHELLANGLPYLKYRTFTAAWTLEAAANLAGVDIQLGDGTAEGVAVHAEFLSSLALVSPVMRKHFDEIALFELADGFIVGNAAVMHLGHKDIQFTFHFIPLSYARVVPAFRPA